MTTKTIDCVDCGESVPYGRLSCPACGALLASVAGALRAPLRAVEVGRRRPNPEPEASRQSPSPRPTRSPSPSPIAAGAPEPDPVAEPTPVGRA